jgi:hypothetical protein
MPRLLSYAITASLLSGCAQTATATRLPGADAATPIDAPVDAPVPVDVPRPAVDAGVSALSDDCRPGTWCWERPRPTGEVAVAAAVTSPDRAVFITEGGTLAAWDGARWSTRQLTLPGQPTGLLLGADGELVVTVVDRVAQRERWVVELRGDAQGTVPLAGEGYVSRPTASGSTVWALGTREVFRRRGATWETIPGPAGSPVLSGLHVVGPDEVIALESWGSGSGTGVLHRYRAGAWEVVVDFRSIELRVEGPIVAHGGALWMRTFDTNTMEAGVIRVAGAEVESVVTPRGLGSISLHGVGDGLWLLDGTRAWRREGDGWTPLEGFPGQQYGVIEGVGEDVAWVWSNGIHRWRAGAWERLGEGDQPTGNFWDVSGQPLLVSQRPAGFLGLTGGSHPGWALAISDARGPFVGDSPPVDGVGYVAITAGVIQVPVAAIASINSPALRWPVSVMGGRVAIGGSAAGVWAWVGAEGFTSLAGRPWTAVAGPTFADVPRAEGYNVDAVHYTADARLFLAASMVTGDKQVRRRVFVREGEAWRQVVAEMGVFGRTESAFVVGDRAGEVFIGLSGLYRYDGTTATLLTPDLDVQGLSRRADGGAVALTPTAVVSYSAAGVRVGQVALPPVRAYFTRVHQTAAGVVRVANPSGWVMRYTP